MTRSSKININKNYSEAEKRKNNIDKMGENKNKRNYE